MRQLERALTTVMALAAITVAALLVRREVAGSGRTNRQEVSSAPIRIEDDLWRRAVMLGRLATDSAPGNTIVVFSDFECPACRAFHESLKDVAKESRERYEVRYVHTPLPYHRFAHPAARMSECAAQEGQFRAITDALFEHQDSLGLTAWIEIARRAGIGSPEVVADCAGAVADDARFERIREGLELGRTIGIEGTPTVVINGLKFDRPPGAEQIVSTLSARP